MTIPKPTKIIVLAVLSAAFLWFAGKFIISYYDLNHASVQLTTMFNNSEQMRKDELKKQDAIIKDASASITARDKTIKQLQDEAGYLAGVGANTQAHLTDLQKRYLLLTTCPEKLDNALLQITDLNTQVSNARADAVNAHKQAAAFEAQYYDEVKIADGWKLKYDTCFKSLNFATADISALQGDVRRMKLTGLVKDGIIVAAVGYLVYNLLKK